MRPGAGRFVLVNHWATWCEGCVEELAELVRLHTDLSDRVDFVGVGWEGFMGGFGPDSLDAVRREAHVNGLTWTTWVFDGEPDELFEGLDLSFRFIPQTALIDSSGAVVADVRGPLDARASLRLREAVEGAQK